MEPGETWRPGLDKKYSVIIWKINEALKNILQIILTYSGVDMSTVVEWDKQFQKPIADHFTVIATNLIFRLCVESWISL